MNNWIRPVVKRARDAAIFFVILQTRQLTAWADTVAHLRLLVGKELPDLPIIPLSVPVTVQTMPPTT